MQDSKLKFLYLKVGNRLLENASNNQVRLESGEVIGFKHDALLSMCFYHRSMQQCGEDIARFTSCSLPCRQHSNIVITVESEVLVNVRMLAPDDTYDKAYVIRVENETVIYFVEGPFCTVEKHLHTLKPPMLLLQIPANNGCVTTTGSLLPTPETQATPSINLGKTMELTLIFKNHIFSTLQGFHKNKKTSLLLH